MAKKYAAYTLESLGSREKRKLANKNLKKTNKQMATGGIMAVTQLGIIGGTICSSIK